MLSCNKLTTLLYLNFSACVHLHISLHRQRIPVLVFSMFPSAMALQHSIATQCFISPPEGTELNKIFLHWVSFWNAELLAILSVRTSLLLKQMTVSVVGGRSYVSSLFARHKLSWKENCRFRFISSAPRMTLTVRVACVNKSRVWCIPFWAFRHFQHSCQFPDSDCCDFTAIG